MTVPLEARDTRRGRVSGPSAAVVPAGLAFLLARPGLEALPASGRTAVLAAGYLALATAAAAATRAGRPLLHTWVALAAGMLAVAAVTLLAGPSPPVPAGRAALALGLLAAVAEEALFRGALFAWLERGGAALAVALSALLFALVHVPSYGLAALPVDLGAGLLLGWQRWASGRWTVPAATHAAANLLAVILW